VAERFPSRLGIFAKPGWRFVPLPKALDRAARQFRRISPIGTAFE
jgi:hypothetical protein